MCSLEDVPYRLYDIEDVSFEEYADLGISKLELIRVCANKGMFQ